jgi:SAM-dependent methyltransferase
VLEHIHDRVPPGCALEELIVFSGSGARNHFREAHRVLRPGGRLLLTTPNANSVDTIANVLAGRHPFLYQPHVREYTRQDVIGMAVAAAFEVELADTYFAWQLYSDDFRGQIAVAAAGLVSCG